MWLVHRQTGTCCRCQGEPGASRSGVRQPPPAQARAQHSQRGAERGAQAALAWQRVRAPAGAGGQWSQRGWRRAPAGFCQQVSF